MEDFLYVTSPNVGFAPHSDNEWVDVSFEWTDVTANHHEVDDTWDIVENLVETKFFPFTYREALLRPAPPHVEGLRLEVAQRLYAKRLARAQSLKKTLSGSIDTSAHPLSITKAMGGDNDDDDYDDDYDDYYLDFIAQKARGYRRRFVDRIKKKQLRRRHRD